MTTRGRTLAALTVSMIVFGRLSGMRELFMSGVAFALILAMGFVLVWLRGGKVRAHRTIAPPRTIVGSRVRIDLSVEATGRLGVGPVLLADRLPPDVGPSPRLALPGGYGSRNRSVAYTVAPRMRGRYPIGPLEITHTDPFGAVRRRVNAPGTTPLVVYPAYEEISVLPTAVQRLGVVRHSPLVGHGDEFYALRSYQEGDDLRKIHWPSSLRTGELVIRQEELLSEPRALIVLDTSASKHRGIGPGASLEAAVSACASLGVLAVRRRMRLDIVTSEGPLLETRSPNVDQLLEALAMLKVSGRASLASAIKRTERPRGGRPALVVVISPDLRKDEVRAVALRARGSVAGAMVWIDAESFDPQGPARVRSSSRPRLDTIAFPIVALRAGDSFRHVWHTTIKDVALAR